jgi:predicted GIY-YIG superfamily endonuclease
LLFVQSWPSRSEALKAEHAMKRLSPEAKRKLIENA